MLAAGEQREAELTAEVDAAPRAARGRPGQSSTAHSRPCRTASSRSTRGRRSTRRNCSWTPRATRTSPRGRECCAGSKRPTRSSPRGCASCAPRSRRRLDEVEEARAAQAAHNDEVDAARGPRSATVRATAEAQAGQLAALRDEQAAALDGLQSQISGWSDQVQEARAAAAAEAAAAAAQPVGSGDVGDPGRHRHVRVGRQLRGRQPVSGAGGAYQILPSTWALYGGQGLPQNASPAEQDRIAALIWGDSGGGAWVCAG